MSLVLSYYMKTTPFSMVEIRLGLVDVQIIYTQVLEETSRATVAERWCHKNCLR
ncbi:hypothetical protein GCM10027287_29940 [Bordetella muralis]